MRAITVFTVVGAMLFLAAPAAQAAAVDKAASRTQKQAMGLARAGNHDRALTLLDGLRQRYPDYYPFQRDTIVIASWKKDCQRVLATFESISPENQSRPQALLPSAECLREQNRVRAAIRALEEGNRVYPRDSIIQAALTAARQELNDQRVTTEGLFYTDSSDAGNREYRLEGKIWAEVADHTFAYARLARIWADDPVISTGELTRAVIGIDRDIGRFTVGADISGDLVIPDEQGVSGRVRFRPNDLWNLFGAYHSFSEEVPLRGKAIGVTSDQWHFDSYYHSSDYIWEWFFAADAFDFSDTNQRREWYSEVTYGLDLQEKHEKRVVLELAQSRNTLAPTVYYNPLSATTIIGGYKYLWVVDSKYKRHADDIYVWAGIYDQQNYGAAPIYGVRYQQTYQFTDDYSLNWFVSLASHVYDGGREAELDAGIRAVYVLP
jgi:biofilm PGA synthesis protein PgaA